MQVGLPALESEEDKFPSNGSLVHHNNVNGKNIFAELAEAGLNMFVARYKVLLRARARAGRGQAQPRPQRRGAEQPRQPRVQRGRGPVGGVRGLRAHRHGGGGGAEGGPRSVMLGISMAACSLTRSYSYHIVNVNETKVCVVDSCNFSWSLCTGISMVFFYQHF